MLNEKNNIDVSETKRGQLFWNFDEPKKKSRKKEYHGKVEQQQDNDAYEVEVIRRKGSSLVSVELRHDNSGYCDRIVLMEGTGMSRKISIAKKQLINIFNVEKKMGIHTSQRFRRGDYEFERESE